MGISVGIAVGTTVGDIEGHATALVLMFKAKFFKFSKFIDPNPVTAFLKNKIKSGNIFKKEGFKIIYNFICKEKSIYRYLNMFIHLTRS